MSVTELIIFFPYLSFQTGSSFYITHPFAQTQESPCIN